MDQLPTAKAVSTPLLEEFGLVLRGSDTIFCGPALYRSDIEQKMLNCEGLRLKRREKLPTLVW
jgi:hypothetical protein